jgi:hypothetical protein
MVAASPYLFYAGAWSILDGADNPDHGALGQALVLSSGAFLVGGLTLIAAAIIRG